MKIKRESPRRRTAMSRAAKRRWKCWHCGAEGPRRAFDKAYLEEALDLVNRYSDEEGSSQDSAFVDGDELVGHVERLRRLRKHG